jgi:phosphoribosylanthranilate isomerase
VSRVKICGINDAVSFDAAVKAGVDWLGFVFFPGSPRCITPMQAATLSARRPGGPRRVALLVNPADNDVAEVVAVLKPDVLQLYGPRARAAELRRRFGLTVWQAVGVSDVDDLPADADGVDALLIDAKPPAGATRPGGNAGRFDWGLLADWKPTFDWLLAGGLTPDNVAEAIRVTGAAAVDVSSGVESAPGVKDPALIAAFARAAAAVGPV